MRAIVERTEFFRADEEDVAVELVDEHLENGMASGYHFVFAEAAGALVGYACFWPIACTFGSFDLYWIAVDPAFQGQGLGRVLMAAAGAEIAAAGGRRVFIELIRPASKNMRPRVRSMNGAVFVERRGW